MYYLPPNQSGDNVPLIEKKRLTSRNTITESLGCGAQEEQYSGPYLGHIKIKTETLKRQRGGEGCSGRNMKRGGYLETLR